MDSNKKAARLAGVLFMAGTIAGIISLGLFTSPVLSAPDYLGSMAANESKILIGVLLELVMGIVLVGMAIVLYPVLRRHSPGVAIGYFGVRTVEFVIGIIGAISLLALVTLSKEFVGAGSPDASQFQTLGMLLLAARDWGGHVVLDVAVFPLGALMLYYLLYRTRLVPRWISGWGLIGAIVYWAAGMLVMFDLIVPLEPFHIALSAPLGVQELVLALWLIVKGFSPSAAVAQ